MITSYTYPDSDVLRNKLNIRDQKELDKAEAAITAVRLKQLVRNPVKGEFDLKHFRRIHKYIFGDIYEWAGEIRNCNIAKSNLFCLAVYIPSFAESVFSELEKEDYLKGLDRNQFVKRCAYFFGEVNALHPFREGNGRVEREFFRELALNAGWFIDWSMVTEDDIVDASIASFSSSDNRALERMLDRIVKKEK